VISKMKEEYYSRRGKLEGELNIVMGTEPLSEVRYL